MKDHCSFSVQKIKFLNHVFKLFNFPIVMKYDGVSRLEICLFPYVLFLYKWFVIWGSRPGGPPSAPTLKNRNKDMTSHQKSATKSQCPVQVLSETVDGTGSKRKKKLRMSCNTTNIRTIKHKMHQVIRNIFNEHYLYILFKEV